MVSIRAKTVTSNMGTSMVKNGNIVVGTLNFFNIENGNIEFNIKFFLTLKTVTSNLTSNFSNKREHQEAGWYP